MTNMLQRVLKLSTDSIMFMVLLSIVSPLLMIAYLAGLYLIGANFGWYTIAFGAMLYFLLGLFIAGCYGPDDCYSYSLGLVFPVLPVRAATTVLVSATGRYDPVWFILGDDRQVRAVKFAELVGMKRCNKYL